MKNSLIVLAGAISLCLVDGCSPLHSNGWSSPETSNTKYRVVPLPPQVARGAAVDDWMHTNGFAWERNVLLAGVRTLYAYQLMPYSGLPGIHVSIYEKKRDSLTLLLWAVIANPPHYVKGRPLVFSYDAANDSIKVVSEQDTVLCLDIRLSTM